MMPKDHVFVSYSSKDSATMRTVVDQCRANGYKCWVDETGFEPGSYSWTREIETAIEQASCLIVLLSPSAKESDWVRMEIRYAKMFNLAIFPMLIGGVMNHRYGLIWRI